MRFDELPDEIKLKVFYCLTNAEIRSIIPHLPKQAVVLANARLYRDQIRLINPIDLDWNNFDSIIDVPNFCHLVGNQLLVPTKKLIIQFGIDAFSGSTFPFLDLLKEHPGYFRAIDRVEMNINAEYDITSFETMDKINQLLVISSEVFSSNLRDLSIIGSIGEFWPVWGSILHKFDKLLVLSLQSCDLHSSDCENQDILGSIQFPPKLQCLYLGDNHLQFISSDFINNLPKSLSELSFIDNKIEKFDIQDIESILPDLHSLDLSYNPLDSRNPA